eukprot:TRINITY_DN66429_c5_g3_i1.p1 TRINITY_DN66429_c5_g3~~TRINITY_DN66429_c5_g3_i1.p1  ORF type:complete len:529 (+),score=43.50 TRINITY_DN66429_c5_g3_i1:46-1632(+)
MVVRLLVLLTFIAVASASRYHTRDPRHWQNRADYEQRQKEAGPPITRQNVHQRMSALFDVLTAKVKHDHKFVSQVQAIKEAYNQQDSEKLEAGIRGIVESHGHLVKETPAFQEGSILDKVSHTTRLQRIFVSLAIYEMSTSPHMNFQFCGKGEAFCPRPGRCIQSTECAQCAQHTRLSHSASVCMAELKKGSPETLIADETPFPVHEQDDLEQRDTRQNKFQEESNMPPPPPIPSPPRLDDDDEPEITPRPCQSQGYECDGNLVPTCCGECGRRSFRNEDTCTCEVPKKSVWNYILKNEDYSTFSMIIQLLYTWDTLPNCGSDVFFVLPTNEAMEKLPIETITALMDTDIMSVGYRMDFVHRHMGVLSGPLESTFPVFEGTADTRVTKAGGLLHFLNRGGLPRVAGQDYDDITERNMFLAHPEDIFVGGDGWVMPTDNVLLPGTTTGYCSSNDDCMGNAVCCGHANDQRCLAPECSDITFSGCAAPASKVQTLSAEVGKCSCLATCQAVCLSGCGPSSFVPNKHRKTR